jgi:DNA helicase II / ATP-dependent DNA helicase PcrA
MTEYLLDLNAVQRQAVTQVEGPVLVVAGPGSGKTRVLTFRIAHLIEQGVAPWEILALTFTNKAAREMKERIEKVIGQRAAGISAGTFHAIFARILRSEADRIGYPRDFSIYDSDDSKSLLRTIVKEMQLAKDVYGEGAILSRISSAKSNLISPKAYAERADLMSEDRATRRPHLQKIYEEYMVRCRRAGAMDFDDLLYYTFYVLHLHADVAEKYRKKFKYVMVDEFQDTNFLQYSIIKKLVVYDGSPRNVCVVGDDAQSIYAFRGATIQNILDFEADFTNLQTFKLEQNYRSTVHIVEAANEVIGNNRRQIQKKIWTDKLDSQRIKVMKTLSDQEEAKRIADLILEQKNRHHLRNSEIAILYRTNAQSRPFEEALRRMNLAYRVYGGTSFYQRKEVKDVLAYLRVLVNPRDEEALRRIINYPRRGIGDATVEKMSQQASAAGKSLWELLPDYEGTAREKKSLNGFITLIKAFMQRAKSGNAAETAQYVVRQAEILSTLKQDMSLEGIGRLDNVQALLDAISEFVDNDEVTDDTAPVADKSLSSYLSNIALLTDADNADPNADVITLMSVHSAKGLEFKSVVVGGLEENLFPSFMSFSTPEGLDEERRLFYVAITRAESFLTLSFSASRYQHGKMVYNEQSRFLSEISAEHLDSNVSGTALKSSNSMHDSPQRARISGNFSKPNRLPEMLKGIDPANFIAATPDKIQVGMMVLHLRFGEGKVLNIEGAKDNPLAEIHFEALGEKKKIALKFAKLQIM